MVDQTAERITLRTLRQVTLVLKYLSRTLWLTGSLTLRQTRNQWWFWILNQTVLRYDYFKKGFRKLQLLEEESKIQDWLPSFRIRSNLEQMNK